jgi:gluconolactonase
MPDAAVPQVFAEGFTFPEGPAFDRAGDLFVVNIPTGEITRVKPDGTCSLFVQTGGKPNGAAFHANGELWVADCGLRAIIAVSTSGEIRMMADRCAADELRGPNDLVLDREGNAYFTDPAGSTLEKPIGCVYCATASGDVRRLAEGLAYPNGIALSANEDRLYVAETHTRSIWEYPLVAVGNARERRLYGVLEGGTGPDGMAFDENGLLYVANFGAGNLAVFEPGGGTPRYLPAGDERPTNVAFGGPRGTTLFITGAAENKVLTLELGVKGQRLYGDH